MEDKIAILIPTRKRLLDFRIFANSWSKTTEGKSSVFVGINLDDSTYDDLINGNTYPFIWERGKSQPWIHVLNDLALKYAQEYKYITFMQDDALYGTKDWETPIINKLEELGPNGIVWCNDLLNKEKLIGFPFMHSSMIKILGYMCPPELRSSGTDVYHTFLGRELKTIYYFENIITEHRHFTTGKRLKDDTSVKIQFEPGTNDSLYLNSQEFKNKIIEDAKKLYSYNNNL